MRAGIRDSGIGNREGVVRVSTPRFTRLPVEEQRRWMPAFLAPQSRVHPWTLPVYPRRQAPRVLFDVPLCIPKALDSRFRGNDEG